MRTIYTLLSCLAMPFVMLRLLWRSRLQPAYRYRWNERFARYHVPALSSSIWVHTVSVGEFMAALPMLKQLRQRHPNVSLVITTTTPTGSAQVRKHFGDDVTHVYLPYDLPWLVRRFLKHMKPKIAVIMETELWPNVLHGCYQNNVPIMLANARLSQRSKEGYARIAGVARNMLRCMTAVASQCQADGDRFVDLGLPRERLQVLGNIKFDVALPEGLDEQVASLRQSWGGDQRMVLTVASTHDGEELHIISLLKALREAGYSQVLVVLVPRHPDRFDRVYQLCADAGFKVSRRSQGEPITADTDILLGDTMGEMKLFCAASDMAFFGGSIKPIGGHNLIEAAIFGVPVLSGHHMQNFVALRDMLLEKDALLISDNDQQLLDNCRRLIDSAQLRHAMGQRARDVVMANQGALKRHLDCIDHLLQK